jgi:hypothetical protein
VFTLAPTRSALADFAFHPDLRLTDGERTGNFKSDSARSVDGREITSRTKMLWLNLSNSNANFPHTVGQQSLYSVPRIACSRELRQSSCKVTAAAKRHKGKRIRRLPTTRFAARDQGPRPIPLVVKQEEGGLGKTSDYYIQLAEKLLRCPRKQR